METSNSREITDVANRIYEQLSHVPYMGTFRLFAKRTDMNEVNIHCVCSLDERIRTFPEVVQNYKEVAKSKPIEVNLLYRGNNTFRVNIKKLGSVP